MKILSFGSLNIDRVYQMAEFVKAGETVASTGFSMVAGGKGLNQSIALAKAGNQVWQAGAAGSDGGMLLETLSAAGVDTSCVKISSQPTGHAVIQVDRSGQNCIIISGGANLDITEEDIDAVLSRFSAGDILVLQNEISNIPYLLRRGRELGMKVVMNPSPLTPELSGYPLECADLLILNEIEGAFLAGETEPDRITACLRQKYPHSDILLTLGGDGSRYLGREGSFTCGIFPVNAVDTTAAGDTFCGYFLTCISRGMAVDGAMRCASAASAIAVSRPGASTSVPTMKEVEAFLTQQV